MAFQHQDRQIEKKSQTLPISRQIQLEYGTAKNRVQDNFSCFETSLGIGDSSSQMAKTESKRKAEEQLLLVISL